MGIGEPSDLRLAQSIDAHQFTAGVPMLTQCLAQPLTLLGNSLVDCILGIAGGAKGMNGRNLIPHSKRVETAIAVVELGAYLRHRIMCVVGYTDGSAVLDSPLRRLLFVCLATIIFFSLGSDMLLAVREYLPRQFHSDSRLYHVENLLSCDDRHTFRELDRMQLAKADYRIIGPHVDAEQLSDLLGAIELLMNHRSTGYFPWVRVEKNSNILVCYLEQKYYLCARTTINP